MYKLSKNLQDGPDYIFENQDDKHKNAYYDFISVIF